MCRVIITDTVISGSIVCFPVGSLSLSGAEQTAVYVTGDAVQPRIFWGFFLLRENQRHSNLTRAFTSTRRVG